MSCSSSNETAVLVTFFITAPFSSLLTLALTLLFVYKYIKRNGLIRKESVKPVEQDSYEEVQVPYVGNRVPLATNPAYEVQRPRVNSPVSPATNTSYEFVGQQW